VFEKGSLRGGSGYKNDPASRVVLWLLARGHLLRKTPDSIMDVRAANLHLPPGGDLIVDEGLRSLEVPNIVGCCTDGAHQPVLRKSHSAKMQQIVVDLCLFLRVSQHEHVVSHVVLQRFLVCL